MGTLLTDLEAVEDHHMTEDEERDYYTGTGFLEFFVIQKHKDTFEVEVIDYTGCVNWLQEGLGIEYALAEGIIGEPDMYREGCLYRIEDINVHYIRGDGWMTDDDEMWESKYPTYRPAPVTEILHKIKMVWWRLVWCHVRNFNARRKTK